MAEPDPLLLLKKHGTNATSFQLLEPGIEHWFSSKHDAFVGYADTGAAWVVLGEPIAAKEAVAEVRAELAEAAAKAGRRLRHFALEERPEELRTLVIGETPEWHPGAWTAAVAAKRSLREQLRRSRAKGVVVDQVQGAGAEAELEALASRWTETRQMATMRFAVRVDLIHHGSERRYFFARLEGELVAALVAVPIYARDGWLIEDLLRSPSAPNGTTELLVDAAMRSFEAQEVPVVSMGLAPLAAIDSKLLALIRGLTPWLFDWDGVRSFKGKLGPSKWKPVYAAWPRRERGLSAMLDILRCFAGMGLASFAIRTALHRYRAVLWLLAIMLVPWIAALASPGAARFFPSAEAQVGWITFDVLLFVGLTLLAIDFQRPLAQLLTLAIAADVVVGTWQLVSWNAERASSLDWLVLGVALLAPAIAFIFFIKLLTSGPVPTKDPAVADPVAT